VQHIGRVDLKRYIPNILQRNCYDGVPKLQFNARNNIFEHLHTSTAEMLTGGNSATLGNTLETDRSILDVMACWFVPSSKRLSKVLVTPTFSVETPTRNTNAGSKVNDNDPSVRPNVLCNTCQLYNSSSLICLSGLCGQPYAPLRRFPHLPSDCEKERKITIPPEGDSQAD
jgi:hypothetical protein